jgi:AcrR family transcriptional regulator
LERVRAALQGQDLGGAVLEELTPEPERIAANVEALLAWWGGVSDRPALRADQHGLMPFDENGWVEGSRGRFLFRLACLGVNLCRSPEGDVAFGVLDQAGFFGSLYDNPGSAEQLVDELFEQGLGRRVEMFESLHLYLLLARGLRGTEAFCEGLADMDTGEALAHLWQRLGAYQMDVECLWVARELSMFGLLRQEELRSLRVVPTAEARLAAFRIGMLPTARAASLPALIAQSRALTQLLSPELEAPLVALWRAYGDRPPTRFWSR